jgi:hypothetical protein
VRGDGSERPATAAARTFWSVLKPHADRLMDARGVAPQVAIWKGRKNELFHFGMSSLEVLADAIDAYTDHFYWRSIPCRFIDSALLSDDGLLSGPLQTVRLLVMPHPYYLTQDEADAVDRWVRAGGVLLTEAHLGGYDGTKGRHSEVLPGCGLADRWGLREVESTASVHLDQTFGGEGTAGKLLDEVRKALDHFGATGGRFFPIQDDGGGIIAGCDRFAIIEGAEARIVGSYGGRVPVLVRKPVGAGRVFYCGTNLGCGSMRAKDGFIRLMSAIETDAKVSPVLSLSVIQGGPVRIDSIGGGDSPEYIAIYNRGEIPGRIRMGGSGSYRDIFTGAELSLGGESEIPGRFAGLFARS